MLPNPLKDKTGSRIILWALVSSKLLLGSVGAHNRSPHTVYSLTWQIVSQTGEVVWKTTGQHALTTWWPTLTPDFCQLAAGLDSWDIATYDHNQLTEEMQPTWAGGEGYIGCSTPKRRCRLAGADFYVCPWDGRDRATAYKCGGYNEMFCAAWGCETTGDAYWKPHSSWDKIKVTRGWKRPPREPWPNNCYGNCDKDFGNFNCTEGKCLPLNITFTEQGKKATEWQQGYTWGLRWYLTSTDRGLTFKIQLKAETIVSRSVGPNQVLADQRPPSLPKAPATLSLTNFTTTPTTISTTLAAAIEPERGTGDRLLNLIRGAYQALNHSDPDWANNCWLCLNPSPPYYEGIALWGNYSNVTSPPPTCQGMDHHLTLTQVTGTGSCLGTTSGQPFCNSTIPVIKGNYYLVPPNGTFWACNTGLTPCISAAVFNQTYEYCVLVQIWPCISYHSDETVLQYYEYLPRREKREPISLTLAVLLGIGGITAGIATGATTLVRTDQYVLLHQAMNEDLRVLEKSVRALTESLTSLSEVVLQNRRGLDLLFLKEGGLCAVLREECCFYADRTGIVTETLDKLKERLKKRKKEFEAQQTWYEGLWNRSPWFTTLVSSLMGPIILLMLILTFGPCILNRLTQFIKDRLLFIQTLVLTSQYQRLNQTETEIP